MTFYLWSKTASDNDTADPTANLREGWSPSIVNNSIRALMAAAAKYRDDISGILQTSGSASAYAVATNQYLTSGIPDSFAISFRVHASNNDSATLNPDAQGDKPLRLASGIAIPKGVLIPGNVYKATYVQASDEFLLHGAFGGLASSTIDIPFLIGDNTNVITTGLGSAIGPFDFAFDISAWSLLSWQTGSISVDLYKCTYAQWDAGATHPVSGDKITASAPLAISSALKNQSSALTGWTTTVNVGDILVPNVASVTSVKRLQGMLKALKKS